MKIIFAGTPKFAAHHLEILTGSQHEVVAVLTQPDRKSGRGSKVSTSPVKDKATEKGIKILQPNSLKEEGMAEKLQSLQPDIIFVVAYGLLVPTEVLNIPKLCCLNVHASLLPRWRGAAPMEYAIQEGDKESGLTFMRMTEGLDEGPMLKMLSCNLTNDETLGSLEEKFMNLSTNGLLGFLEEFEKGLIPEVEQQDKGSSYAHKIDNHFKQLDWAAEESREIERRVRALEPKHGAFSFLGKDRIKISASSFCESNTDIFPGHIEIVGNEIIVGCKNNTRLKIENLQMAGKKSVGSEDFIRGYKKLLLEEKKFSYIKS